MPSDSPGTEEKVGAAILDLLRGRVPGEDVSAPAADATLQRLECGGYLRTLWQKAGRSGSLPRGWAEALERAYKKTLVDTLAALADFRLVSRHFAAEGVPFVLLKGAAYLSDLYDDPGERPLTDIDLLIRPADALRIYTRLKEAGFATLQWDDEYRRFEMIAPGVGRCSFEAHWQLGLSERNIDQDEIWARCRPSLFEEAACLRLCREDALLFHVAHQADHFFAPSLKWVVDLRLMLGRWSIDPESLMRRADRWRVRTALTLAILYLDKIFPGETPELLRRRLRLGCVRRGLLRPFLDPAPLWMMRVGSGRIRRYSAACLLVDRPMDVLKGLARAVRRPFLRRLLRDRKDGAPPQIWH